MNIKKILFGTAILSLAVIIVFNLNSCNETENKEVKETEKVNEIVPVKKTRAELIVNRNVMAIAKQDSITDFENKHTPEITIGEIDEKGYAKINVSVGSAGIVHPSTEEHWIDFMTLFIDGEKFKHIEIENGEGSTKQEFFAPIKKGQVIKVQLGCNIHGIWENTITVM